MDPWLRSRAMMEPSWLGSFRQSVPSALARAFSRLMSGKERARCDVDFASVAARAGGSHRLITSAFPAPGSNFSNANYNYFSPAASFG
jgi:hypothetical protein